MAAARLPELAGGDARVAAVETRRLLRAVEATWDRERFADDPRKFAAPIHHFAGDHLIPMIAKGLERLEALGGGRAEVRGQPTGVAASAATSGD